MIADFTRSGFCGRTRGSTHLRERYSLDVEDVDPRVFYRLTDNWIELSVRFLVRAHGVREVKDRIARELLPELRRARIDVASATYEIVGLPSLRLRIEGSDDDSKAHVPS
jgi:hypothetical protein